MVRDQARNAVALEQEYEHMQTGYFHRTAAMQDPPADAQ